MAHIPHLSDRSEPVIEPAPTSRGTVNLRIEAETRRLIDEAAALVGKTRTDFMVESARQQAMDVLLDRRLFTLDNASFDAFSHSLDHPPTPGPKLRALMSHVPVWKRTSE